MDSTVEFVLEHLGMTPADLPPEPEVQLGVWYFRDEPPPEPPLALFENTRS